MKLATKSLQLAFFLVLFYSPVSEAWSSTLPSTIQALRGSCVVIPCSFTYPGSRDSWEGKFSVAWYQYRSRGYPEIYNSQSPETVLPDYQGRTEVLGDLEMGNCTLSISPVRNEDSMSYYVWINPDSVKHRFYDITVRVEVTETPNQLELSDPGLLTEGDHTLVTCSTLHTCPLAPPILTWNLDGPKAVTVQERLAGGAWRTESGFSYTPSHKDHGKYLQCTATFPNQQQSRNGIYLQVKYTPKNAVVSVVGNPTLKEGDSVTLRCSSQSNPPPISYRWFIGPRKAPLRAAGTGPEVKVADIRRDSGPFHCVAENDVGMGEDSPPTYLNVEYKPVILPQGNCTVSRTGETVTCYCVAEGNPLPSIEWRFPNRTVPGDFNSSDLQAASASWGQAIIGVLRGSASTLANVSCTATNQHGPSQVTLPTIQAVDMTLILMVSGGAVGGVLFLSLMGIVGYKMATSRKKGGNQEEEEEEDPTLYVTDGALEQKKPEKKEKPAKKEKPPKSKKEEQLNMYSKPKPKAGGNPTDDNDLNTEAYENMEIAEDYENVSTGASAAGLYGNLSNWQTASGSDQIYSNV
ncbi:myelin-associated glycoprotein-like [Sceloporus undulatus]|uniref:myelin-associated glycoprotein-like n=1 Tax=Sceloporus undulatus TaxID=8520 RepID=UPI001C4D35A9|nr:myelin-associated glycoprotein-like [Sceloporus undulatus]XP_042296602.1 myelin-associated glycoprotein-like [Sceloporus undulatus]XP_042296603.1 myelin-associated glycoprotein-like [Sceloporus undulatus]XP_042296604.1 myelin-associated glycoprotein-like [Sceloporus undulatus]